MTALTVPRLGVPAVSAWRAHGAALAVAVAALLLVFREAAVAMVHQWVDASSYEHCLVIVPVLGWLVWLRRGLLAGVRPRAWAPPLGWVALGALGWLVGQAGGVTLARELGLVMMLQGTVAALLGRAATAVLLFPLGYTFFLVPAGDALVPPLQTLTARMCMALLHLARVPARIDGVFITTPGGWFKVAEACSGTKFLLAMVALGVLVAHLGFRRWGRRLAFLLLCGVVPVLANGVRAFSTIWVAQRVGAVRASGFDHIVYGWFFFAAVIAAVLAASWRFFDRAADAAPLMPEQVVGQDRRQRRTMPLAAALCAVLGLAAAAPLWATLAVAGATPVPATARLPDLPGWTRIGATGEPWRPRFDGADRLLVQRYRDPAGAQVDVAVALYAAQDERRTLVGFGHGAVDPDGRWAWAEDRPAPAGWSAERIGGPAHLSREVLTTYRVGDTTTASPAHVKLETLRRHLLGGDQRAAALLVSAEAASGGRPAVDAMLRSLGDPTAFLDRVAAGR